MSNPASTSSKNLLRLGFIAGLLLGTLSWAGCSSVGGQSLAVETVAAMSPAPQVSEAATAMHLARRYVENHPGTQIAIGTGDSMLPLYRDNTVIVIKMLPMEALKRGMTVVYNTRDGWPLAHALVCRAKDGWVAKGLNNPECDPETVCGNNFVGVVVKAYESTNNPMLALSRALSTESEDVAIARSPLEGRVNAIP